MKILQTLGRHSGQQEGIFQYRRTPDGVFIDSGVGRANLTPASITLTTEEWTAILRKIGESRERSFRLTGQRRMPNPPHQSLYALLSEAVPRPTGGWPWQDTWKTNICAILEHEGSIDLYHGPLGPRNSAVICLSKGF
jgi:hypothetical protein